jgi:glycosyltransferase involved in cell wall biosynthesis
MKILHLSSATTGGAGTAACRLHTALLEKGVESKMIVQSNVFNIKRVENLKLPPKEKPKLNYREKVERKIHRIGVEFKLLAPKPKPEAEYAKLLESRLAFLNRRDKRLGLFSYPDGNSRLPEIVEIQSADIVHLHWVSGLIDWSTFFLKCSKPIVFTLHDAYLFSGGYHVLERYGDPNLKGIPQELSFSLEEKNENIKISEIKREGLKSLSMMEIVAPSKWMFNKSKDSDFTTRFRHTIIPNVCSTNIYKLANKRLAKDVFSVVEFSHVFLFVADSAKSYHKGLPYLIAAAKTLNSTACILIVGIDEIEIETAAEVRCLGKIYDERYLALVYAAADFLILPSLADNLPNTMLEALCCGLPVIGFPVGGIPEVVGEQFGNGIICDEISVSGLADAIAKGTSMKGSFDSDYIAHNAAKLFNPETIAEQHISLYKSILESR